MGRETMSYIFEKQPFSPMWRPDAGATPLADYEMIEMVLFRAVPRREVRQLAKDVMARFGSFVEAIAAPPQRLTEVVGMTPGAIAEFKLLEAAVQRFTKEAMKRRLPLGSNKEVIDYCRTATAFEDREIFRVLFLDKKKGLIADEVLGVGTVDHAPVYPREVIRRALELSASAIILVHNHPSGDPTPSPQDVGMTLDIVAASKLLGLVVHDHIIVGRQGHASLKAMGLI
jgi:DNA repair protein RadC